MARSHFDEREWVVHIQKTLQECIDENDENTPASIFCVPEALVSGKPDAYIPQLFAFGPYHHLDPKLYDMQRHKLAAARRVNSRLSEGSKLQQLVQVFVEREHRIRGYYHRFINHSNEAIAWMMVVDASFLLEFLHNFSENSPKFTKSTKIADERMKMTYNMILRDIIMLENQVPLFVLRKLMNFISPETDPLPHIISGFITEICPFKSVTYEATNISDRTHLLELLYDAIVPKTQEFVAEIVDIGEENDESTGAEIGDTTNVTKVYVWFKNLAPSLSGPFNAIKRIVVSGPIKLVVKFVPIFSTFVTKKKTEDEKSADDKPPSVEEITIPSVSELVSAGVKFSATQSDITTIKFDKKTVTLYLPIVTLDVNTEVVLRNLVAYEISVVSGALVFTRYTELMNGIIDTEEDVKLLRERGMIVNMMKSDAEAAKVCNGLSKSVRLTKAKFIDEVIKEVNRYYRSRWKVKGKKFFNKYVFGSWQILTFLAAGLLLFLTCVQAFCSVYTCNPQLAKVSSVSNS